MNDNYDPNETVRVGSDGARNPSNGPVIRSVGPSEIPKAMRPAQPQTESPSGKGRIIGLAALAFMLIVGIAAFGAAQLLSDDTENSQIGVGETGQVDLEAIRDELDANGLTEVSVSPGDDNVDIYVDGTVADLAQQDLATEIVLDSDGVRDADIQLEVESLPRAAAMVNASDGSAIIRGSVTTDEQRAQIVQAVSASYPADTQITDELIVDSATDGLDISIDGDLNNTEIFKALTRNLAGLTQAEGTEMSLADGADTVLNRLFAAEPILFESGTAEISASSSNTLTDAAELLLLYPDARLEIGGHTDSRGSTEINQTLSEQRAQAVLDALRSRGVPNQLTAVGYGETQLVVSPDDTPEAQQLNRRIEFRTL